MLLRCVSSERLRIPVKLAFTPLQGVCIFFNGVKIVWRASAFNVGHHCSFTLSHRAAWRKRKWCCDGRKSALLCSCGFVLPSHCFFSLSCSLLLCRSFSPSLTSSWLPPWDSQVWITSCLGRQRFCFHPSYLTLSLMLLLLFILYVHI